MTVTIKKCCKGEAEESVSLITIEDVKAIAAETDPAKQKEMSERIFKAMDEDHDGSLDKNEMMVLVEAIWKAIPSEIKNMISSSA